MRERKREIKGEFVCERERVCVRASWRESVCVRASWSESVCARTSLTERVRRANVRERTT